MKTSDILKFLDESGTSYKVEKTDASEINGFSSLFQYKDQSMTFIVPERKFSDYKEAFSERGIALIILGEKETVYSCFKNAIRVNNPRRVFFSIVEHFFDNGNSEEITGISSNPEIYKRGSYISPKAKIGNNVRIGIGCVVEGNVVIDDDTEIHHNVVIRNKTRIGKRCMIHSGVVLGEYGFGYFRNEKNEKIMLKHYGGVVIEDDVHIGDNCIVSRGAIDDTVIHKGVKISAFVHIAHNNNIGEHTLITGSAHLCGSVNVGQYCHIGAGSIIRNQCTVGDYATVGLGAVVVKDVVSHAVVVGNPAKVLRIKPHT